MKSKITSWALGGIAILACGAIALLYFNSTAADSVQLSRGYDFVQRDEGLQCLAVSPKGDVAVSGNSTGRIAVWSFRTGTLRKELPLHNEAVVGVSFDSSGAHLVSASYDGRIAIWNTSDWRLLHTFSKPGNVFSIAHCPKGSQLAIGQFDGTITLIDWREGTQLFVKNIHKVAVVSLAFHPNGEALLSGDTSGRLVFWDLKRTTSTTVIAHTGAVRAIAPSLDGALFASGDDHGIVKLWDTQGDEKLFFRSGYPILQLAFIPRTKLLVTTGRVTVIDHWDTTSGQHVDVTQFQRGIPRCVAFDARGEKVAIGFVEGMISVWKIDRH